MIDLLTLNIYYIVLKNLLTNDPKKFLIYHIMLVYILIN